MQSTPVQQSPKLTTSILCLMPNGLCHEKLYTPEHAHKKWSNPTKCEVRTRSGQINYRSERVRIWYTIIMNMTYLTTRAPMPCSG